MFKALLSQVGLHLFAFTGTVLFFAAVLILLAWHCVEVTLYKLKHGWKAKYPTTRWL